MSAKIVLMLMTLFCTALAVVLIMVGFVTINKASVIGGIVFGWTALSLIIIEGTLDES